MLLLAKPPNGDRTRVLPLLRRALCRELTDDKENSVDTLDKHGYHLERFREHMVPTLQVRDDLMTTCNLIRYCLSLVLIVFRPYVRICEKSGLFVTIDTLEDKISIFPYDSYFLGKTELSNYFVCIRMIHWKLLSHKTLRIRCKLNQNEKEKKMLFFTITLLIDSILFGSVFLHKYSS